MSQTMAFLLALVIASALGVVQSQHQSRKLFTELEREQSRTQELEVEWGRLLLEQSTWAAYVRVETIARDSLGMVDPAPGAVVAIEEAR